MDNELGTSVARAWARSKEVAALCRLAGSLDKGNGDPGPRSDSNGVEEGDEIESMTKAKKKSDIVRSDRTD